MKMTLEKFVESIPLLEVKTIRYRDAVGGIHRGYALVRKTAKAVWTTYDEIITLEPDNRRDGKYWQITYGYKYDHYMVMKKVLWCKPAQVNRKLHNIVDMWKRTDFMKHLEETIKIK